MRPLTQHIILPLFAPLAVVALYFTPLSVIGCRTRGLLALAIVLAALIVGIGLGIRGLSARRRGMPVCGWWIAAMCILVLPSLLVLGPLG
ncbi:hypothetical protein [Thiocystis violascens]|uniref:Uncharacterized protein n=1 Tax=Thiocystis violascens (strain ATCC 17096 / DSM 198 / 6111) TaxID=765911 RepID=I3Y8X3_THIV6|nr:hypothetical protein [Thiocystis violascens]AFL73441.1 hypothetical protein Thivi_1435 [Thiocystis violascens DSM 198]